MIFDPNSWERPTPGEMLTYMKQKRGDDSPPSGALIFRKHLSPLAVYKYLHARFGPPYGIMTAVKNPNDSDNLIHWDYIVKAGFDVIHIQGGKRDVHIIITGRKMAPKDWVAFSKALKGDFHRFGTGMQAVGAELQKWTIIANRYAMIADACADLHAQLVDEAEPPDFTPKRRTTERGMRAYHRQIQNVSQRANRLFSTSLSLDLMTPVLAEAFLNLVIFVARKDELKKNPRQYEAYVRQPIDARVFDLHLKCDRFRAGVDPDHEAYKGFKRLMDRRNRVLHGNIDPNGDAIETVYFDRVTPLFETGADLYLELFRKKEELFDIAGVLSRYHDAHTFFVYVLGLLEENTRAGMEMIIADGEIGFDAARGIVGRLFPSHEVGMLMPQMYDDELKVTWR